jgi:hypothetical protein
MMCLKHYNVSGNRFDCPNYQPGVTEKHNMPWSSFCEEIDNRVKRAAKKLCV